MLWTRARVHTLAVLPIQRRTCRAPQQPPATAAPLAAPHLVVNQVALGRHVPRRRRTPASEGVGAAARHAAAAGHAAAAPAPAARHIRPRPCERVGKGAAAGAAGGGRRAGGGWHVGARAGVGVNKLACRAGRRAGGGCCVLQDELHHLVPAGREGTTRRRWRRDGRAGGRGWRVGLAAHRRTALRPATPARGTRRRAVPPRSSSSGGAARLKVSGRPCSSIQRSATRYGLSPAFSASFSIGPPSCTSTSNTAAGEAWGVEGGKERHGQGEVVGRRRLAGRRAG